MQISRMPIPADDCANNEMSVDVNPSDAKSNLETATKVNGDSHKKLNGSVVDDDSKEADEATSEDVVKKEDEETKPVNNIEPLSEITDELVKNGTSEKQVSRENVQETNNEEEIPAVDNDKPNGGDIAKDNDKPIDNQNSDDIVKPMEIDQIEDKPNKDVAIKEELENVTVKQEEIDEQEVPKIVETYKLNNGDTNPTIEVIKTEEQEINPLNGDTRLSDEEKSVKSEKVCQKVPEEEDVSSEMSTDTLSPKQVPNIKYKFH